jgi:hypothetical protein
MQIILAAEFTAVSCYFVAIIRFNEYLAHMTKDGREPIPEVFIFRYRFLCHRHLQKTSEFYPRDLLVLLIRKSWPHCDVRINCYGYEAESALKAGPDQMAKRKIFLLAGNAILFIHPRGPPLWSSGQGSWLQIQTSGFDSGRYQIF